MMALKVSEGLNSTWPQATAMVAEMRRRDIRYRGFYHWLRPDSPGDQQALHFLDVIAKQFGGLHVGEYWMADWERSQDKGGLAHNNGFPTYDIVKSFFATMIAHLPGRGINYSSDWVEFFIQWRKDNPTFPLHYANYDRVEGDPAGGPAEVAKYDGDAWQWTSLYPIPPGVTNHGVPGKGMDMNELIKIETFDKISLRGTIAPPVIIIPPNTENSDMFIANSNVFNWQGQDYDPATNAGLVCFFLNDNGTKRHITSPGEVAARGGYAAARRITADELNSIPDETAQTAQVGTLAIAGLTTTVPVTVSGTGTLSLTASVEG